MEAPKGSYPSAETGSHLGAKGDSSMRPALSGQPEEVLVVGAENPPHSRGRLEVVEILVPKAVQTAGRDDVDPR